MFIFDKKFTAFADDMIHCSYLSVVYRLNYSTGKIELQSYFLRFNKNYEILNKFILICGGNCAQSQ